MKRPTANLKIATLAIMLAFSCLVSLTRSTSTSTQAPSSSTSTSTSSSAPTSRANSHSGTVQQRQSPLSTAGQVIGAIGSLIPGLITNVAPLLALVSLGAYVVGELGLLGQSRRSSGDQLQQPAAVLQFPALFGQQGGQFARPWPNSPHELYYVSARSSPSSLLANVNSAGVMNGLKDILTRVARALENADKRFT